MKKVLVLATVALGFVAGVNAQSVRFGAKGGLNLSTLSMKDSEGIKSLAGFHIGALAEIKLTDVFAVQPELVFSQQGAKTEGTSVGYTAKLKLNYLNIPVMAKFYVIEGLAIEAGPQLGVLLSAKSKVTDNSVSTEEDIKEDVNSTDFGVGFGASYSLPMGVFAGVRYNLGLSNINKEGSNTTKNSVFQVSVGYKF